MVIDFNPKPMRTNSKLAKRDSEGVHPMAKSIGWYDNEAISHLHGIPCIEGQFGFEPIGWIYLSDLNVLSINVLPNDLVHLLLVQWEMARGVQGVFKWGELVH